MKRYGILFVVLVLTASACEHRPRRSRTADPPTSEVGLWADQVSAAKLTVEPDAWFCSVIAHSPSSRAR